MRLVLSILLTCTISAWANAPRPVPGSPQEPEWAVAVDGQLAVRDRLMVRVREQAFTERNAGSQTLADCPSLEAFAVSRGLNSSRPLLTHEPDQVAREAGLDRDLIIEFASGKDLKAEIAVWAARPEVEWAEPDWVVHTLTIPNDTYFSGQWALRNTGQNPPNGTVDCDIDAELAWDISTGSTGVIIAIIDTGVDLNHPDLQAKIVAGYDFVNNDSNPDDDNMHGTACASLAAAVSNNASGMAGVDWNARIMPLKVLNASGSGWDSDIIDAINWARTHGANVISMSLGGGGFNSSFNAAINSAVTAGVFVCAATGNDNASSIDYPAAYTNCFKVGALSPCNQRKSPSSCDGENWWGSNYGTGLDVLAPGVLLRAATNTGGYITNMNGTSGATPHVAGVAALLKGANSSLTPAQIRDFIRSTADDIGAAGYDTQTGYGRLNAYQALLAAAPPDPCDTDLTAPSITHTPLGSTTNNLDPYPVAANVTDACNLASVILRWQVNGGAWSSVSMTHGAGSLYTGAIPAQAYGSLVHYQIVATDASANSNQALSDNNFGVTDPCAGDVDVPLIEMLVPIADTYNTAGPYSALVSVSDPCGINTLYMSYTVNGGAPVMGTIELAGGIEYDANIYVGLPVGATVVYTVYAEDSSPNYNSDSQSWTFHILNPCDTDATAPVITHTPLTDTTELVQPYPVSAQVTDACNIATVTLRRQINGGAWTSTAMTPGAGNTWTGSIPAQAIGSLVHYQIVATDASANANQATADHSFTVLHPCHADLSAPVITSSNPIADTYNTAGPYSTTVSITDGCGIASATLSYTVNGGAAQPATLTPSGGGQYAGVISVGLPMGGTIVYTVTAVDTSPSANTGTQSWTFHILNPCDTELIPPSIAHTPLTDTTELVQPYPVVALVTDDCSVASVILRWQVNGGDWSSLAMTLDAGSWSSAIPAQNLGSLVHYEIVATDASANANQASVDHSFSVIHPCQGDAEAPVITMVVPIADTQDTAGPYSAIISVTDGCGLADVEFTFTVNEGGATAGAITPLDGGQYLCEIPGQPAPSTVNYTLSATDTSPGANAASQSWSFNVLVTPIGEAPVLVISWVGPGEVQLVWNAVAHATGYDVYGAPGSPGPWALLQTTTETTAAIVTSDNETRLFRVVAFN